MELTTAIFYTTDLPRIIGFYRDTLDFDLADVQGDRYAAFAFDNGIRLGIKRGDKAREVPGSQTIILTVKDIEHHFQLAQDKQLTIYKPLTKQSWGTSFSILDPDGNKLEYAQAE
jgi:predicted enzyme related to lactoylglutathione lyase